MKKSVIIDCDPGVDDAIALFMAFASEKLDIKAITTVAGNVKLEKTSKNALKLTEYVGYDVKVAKGASKPIIRELVTAEFVHGESGLGNMVLPEPDGAFYTKNAYDTIYEEATNCENGLEIIALGPLTNIAITLLKYPEIKEKLKHITIMGGSTELGNHTPAAEFNIYVDPEAAKIVFESGIPITMVGLNVTNKAYITAKVLEEILSYNNRPAELVGKSLMPLVDFFKNLDFKGVPLHDPAAMATAIDEGLLETKLLHVDIETKGNITRGKTVVDIYGVTGKKPNANVAVDIDREKFINLFKRLLKSYGI